MLSKANNLILIGSDPHNLQCSLAVNGSEFWYFLSIKGTVSREFCFN